MAIDDFLENAQQWGRIGRVPTYTVFSEKQKQNYLNGLAEFFEAHGISIDMDFLKKDNMDQLSRLTEGGNFETPDNITSFGANLFATGYKVGLAAYIARNFGIGIQPNELPATQWGFGFMVMGMQGQNLSIPREPRNSAETLEAGRAYQLGKHIIANRLAELPPEVKSKDPHQIVGASKDISDFLLFDKKRPFDSYIKPVSHWTKYAPLKNFK